MIVSGVILLFVDVILFGVDEEVASRSTVDRLCMVRTYYIPVLWYLAELWWCGKYPMLPW